jgi:hypothetical protein
MSKKEEVVMKRRDVVGGTIILGIGIAMLGASAGWWDWSAVGAGALIGLGVGMVLQALLGFRSE